MFKRNTDSLRQARTKDLDLEERVRRDLAFLFDQYEAKIGSNTREDHGSSQLSIVVGNLEFQFEKNDRGVENTALVGPRNGHGIWELLVVALAASTGEDPMTLKFPISYSGDPAGLSYVGLSRLASVLKPRFDRLNEAFSPENYPATHARMVKIERILHPK